MRSVGFFGGSRFGRMLFGQPIGWCFFCFVFCFFFFWSWYRCFGVFGKDIPKDMSGGWGGHS